ncbi:ABC transporter substrate-binding protein, partial [candidate division CSSED10-310 bacterium]
QVDTSELKSDPGHVSTSHRDFVFNLRASYAQETESLVDNLVAGGRRRIAVFYQIDAYGRSGWDGIKKALAKHNLKIIQEATYLRGTNFSQSLKEQAAVLKEARSDAIISIGAYAACAAFIRDARDIQLMVPIANVSFVGSESMLRLLLELNSATGRDYTRYLINSQVVPSYTDTSLLAVREYLALMEKYNPSPPPEFKDPTYIPLKQSFVSFEGFLNAKLIIKVLEKMGRRSETGLILELQDKKIRDIL